MVIKIGSKSIPNQIIEKLRQGNYAIFELANFLAISEPLIRTNIKRLIDRGKIKPVDELRVKTDSSRKYKVYTLNKVCISNNHRLIEHLGFIMDFFEMNKSLLLSDPKSRSYLIENRNKFEVIAEIIEKEGS